MSFINITTNNLSRQLRNASTYADNWVYVPGNTITGDYKKPYAFTSLQEFQDACGTRSPEGSKTYEYVAGLLNAGLPVLFRRIAYVGQDNESFDETDPEVVGVKKASYTFTHRTSDEQTVNDFKITEKYGGSYGNDININIRSTGTALWIDVYLKYTLLEKKKIATFTTSDNEKTKNEKIMSGLASTTFDRIDIEVLAESAEKFSMPIQSGIYLIDGADINNALVAAEIPASYSFLKDKILYQPKFITSGGYTDTDMSTSAPIATAMKELSLSRQDCRAIIDIPIGTPAEEQQSMASAVSYQQLSNDQTIPSAMILAPWQYMQVGTAQEWMPPSYAYLTVVGDAVSKGGKSYTPKAGITNGLVSNIIKSEFDIGSDLSEKWQADDAVNINPIMRLQSGSYVIAGNSTLLTKDSDDTELNAFVESSADLTIIEIRRFVYNLATELQYQYNSTDAFETFSIRTAKFLEAMISEGAMTNYDIINVSSESDPRTLKVQLDVYLTPTIKRIEILLNVSYGNILVSTGGAE